MRTLLGAVAAIVGVGLMAGPAAADSADLLTTKDAKNDVRLYSGTYISTAKKKSIDVDKVTFAVLDNGSYRYQVRLKKLYRSKKWDQMIFFESSFPGRDPRFVSVSFRVRSSRGAEAYASDSETNCALTVRRKARSVRVDVPPACAPYPGQVMKLTTYTGHYQSDAPPYSRDRVRVGTVPSRA